MQGKYAHLFQQIDYLAQLWENPVVGLAIIDEHGVFSDANNAYCRILGRQRHEVVGQAWVSFTVDEDLAECQYLISGIQEGKLKDYQLRKRYKIRGSHSIEVVIGVKSVVDDTGKFVCIYKTCVPVEILIDKADLIMQYRPNPLVSTNNKSVDAFDRRINNVYRLVGITLGVGSLAAGAITALYWIFRLVEVFLTHLGGKP